MPIQILAPDVANQIAAGEVVERPASVVKELVENSLDAGASEIRVEVRDGGRRLIRVQDNGSGIPAADTVLLFRRHATSKITHAADLERLATLGFRGEALASIGSVAQVSLATITGSEMTGTLARIVDGRDFSSEAYGGPRGTTVTVEHLFGAFPARLKFLKQPSTESAHIEQVVTRYALAFPDRRFSLLIDGRAVFQSTGSGKLYDVLVKVYGLEVARQMLALAEEDPEHRGRVAVSGYVGAPALNRGNRSYITLFVNGRWFQDNALSYAIVNAYHTLLPVGRFPVAVLFLRLDPGDVDVNVHPTKAEVRFGDAGAIFSAVQRAVRRTLLEQAPIPPVTFATPGAADGPAWQQAAMWSSRRDAVRGAGHGHGMPAEADSSRREYAGSIVAVETDQPARAEPAPLLPLLRAVGQVGSTYIVAEGPDGLYLIDQHAAHERVLYERLVSDHERKAVQVQPLLEPLVVHLTPQQNAALGPEVEHLNDLGVGLEPFGGGAYLLRRLPAILSRDNPESALTEIADGLALFSDVTAEAREKALVTLICKRAAIKGGQKMSLPEMQVLLEELEKCRSPRTCPHGRPTMIHVSSDELARQFGRT